MASKMLSHGGRRRRNQCSSMTPSACRTRRAATTATVGTASPSHTTTTLGCHMKKKQKRKMRRMDAKDGQTQEVFIAQSKGKPGKPRRSSGGAIIASKTKRAGNYEFQGKDAFR